MAEEGTYRLLPYKDIVDLKKEIEDLKNIAQRQSPANLLDSVNSLSKGINELLQFFKTTSDEMKLEESSTEKQLASIIEKLDMIIEQNKTVAEGMVAVADNVKDGLTQISQQQKISPEPKPSFEQQWPQKLEERPPFPPPDFMQPMFPPPTQNVFPPPQNIFQPSQKEQMFRQPPDIPPLPPEELFSFEEPKKKGKGILGLFKK